MVEYLEILTTRGGGAHLPVEVEPVGRVVDGPALLPARFRVLDALVVVVVTSGGGSLRRPGAPPRPVAAGDCIVVRPSEPHWYGPPPRSTWSESFAVIRGALVDDLVDAGWLPPTGVFPAPGGARAAEVLERLALAANAVAERRQLAVGPVCSLLTWLSGIGSPDGVPAPPTGRSREVVAALRVLEEDTRAELSMSEVARRASCSYDVLRRRFAQEVGESLVTYRLRQRCESAARLLVLTDISLREVARRFGFTDEFHFSRTFKRLLGVSPSTYRRAHRQSAAPDEGP